MNAHHDQSILADAVLILIMASFLLIGLCSWIRIRLTGEAMILMPRIVILCLALAAFTGYFPRLIRVDEILLLALHLILATLTWGYAIYAVLDLLDARRHDPPPDS
jgi:hypothetical protein